MAKGPYLISRIKDILQEIYLANKQIKPTEARKDLLEVMKREGLNKIFGSTFPSPSTVSKELKKVRDKDAERPPALKELDKPWSIIAMPKHDIPPETLPVILKVWAYLEKNSDSEDRKEWLTKIMTIRVARWIARLYYVFMEQFGGKQPLEPPLSSDDSLLLFVLAAEYAHLERIVELMDYYPNNYEDMLMLWKPDIELARCREKGSWEIRANELFEVPGMDKKMLRVTSLAQLLKVGRKKGGKT